MNLNLIREIQKEIENININNNRIKWKIFISEVNQQYIQIFSWRCCIYRKYECLHVNVNKYNYDANLPFRTMYNTSYLDPNSPYKHIIGKWLGNFRRYTSTDMKLPKYCH